MGKDIFGAPTDVVVGPNGDIFVSDGHQGCNCENARIVKFDKNGKYLMEFGKKGFSGQASSTARTRLLSIRAGACW